MGWRKGESIIDLRREQIGVNPRATIRALREDLRREDLRPGERVRILGLLITCYRHVGEDANAEAAIAEARAIPRAGKIARAEISGHEATLRIAQARAGTGSWDSALASSIAHLSDAEKLPRLTPKTDWGRRQERTRCTLRVSALVARGQLSLFTGDLDSALLYGYRALQEIPAFPRAGPVPSLAERAPRGPISLVATVLVRGGSGLALDAAAETIRGLIQSLPSTERQSRSCFAALLGCVAARQGRFKEAAEIFEHALDTLAAIGATSSHDLVVEMWKASVRHIADQAALVQEYLSRRRVVLP